MKRIFISATGVLIALFMMGNTDAAAQGMEREGKTTANASQVYLEAGGAGVIYSVNYDGRFGKLENGLGMRVGIGGASASGDGYLAIPAQINYLAGSKGQYFEMGAGVTYISASDIFDEGTSNNLFGSFTLGFRKQPFGKKGLTWRVAFTPFIGEGGFIPWGGASIGFRF
jgi:hypothetical protein